ncbi:MULTISPECIES: hypothetical protein [Kitasatospora]|uniref:hypothetical protein n=1 Tax=Kitasatospora TaxID=2063 RepID=UPI0011D1EE5C|nr:MULTISPECIES: hypothetical protein [Kitasatospora]
MVAAVALLAVSGESGVWRVAVLVGFAVLLGTLSAVLLAARRRPARPVGRAGSAGPAGPPVAARPAPAVRERAYAHQSR